MRQLTIPHKKKTQQKHLFIQLRKPGLPINKCSMLRVAYISLALDHFGNPKTLLYTLLKATLNLLKVIDL